MSDWNPNHYLQFANERTRPATDLVARIHIAQPQSIVDLGCGPGNSTQVLRQRWPDARTIGLDRSPEMIKAARSRFPNQAWMLADAAQWSCLEPVSLIFSNALFQWIPNHQQLVQRLFEQVVEGGILAFQIPSDKYAAVRQHMQEIADDPAWRNRMETAKTALTIEEPMFYYEALADRARTLDIWETEYYHIMEGPESIIDWISSTGLRPFLDALDRDEERQQFIVTLRERVGQSYPSCRNGKVLFPFRRLFVIAYH